MTITTEEAELLAERLSNDAEAPQSARYQPYTDHAMCNAATALRSLAAERDALRASKDAAYEERNRVVALLAAVFPSVLARTAIEGWSEDWHGCIYITLPTGQASWHYHDSHAHLFAHVPEGAAIWDGHTTPEKYERVAAACAERDALQAEKVNLQDDLASVERERVHQHGRADRTAAEYAREQKKREQLQAENARLREALRPFIQMGNVQVGYRVKLNGQEPPPITASEEEAWAHYGGSDFYYQQWLQWRAVQIGREFLGETQ